MPVIDRSTSCLLLSFYFFVPLLLNSLVLTLLVIIALIVTLPFSLSLLLFDIRLFILC
jgi:hypothetical protein